MLTEKQIYYEGLTNAVKRAVIEAEGDLRMAAEACGLSPKSVSRILNQAALRPWWKKYKEDKRKRNARLRKKRWRERRALGLTNL